MLLLTSASDLIRVTSSVAVSTIDVHASWVDMVSGATTGTAGRKNTKVTMSGNTTIVPLPVLVGQRRMDGVTWR